MQVTCISPRAPAYPPLSLFFRTLAAPRVPLNLYMGRGRVRRVRPKLPGSGEPPVPRPSTLLSQSREADPPDLLLIITCRASHPFGGFRHAFSFLTVGSFGSFALFLRCFEHFVLVACFVVVPPRAAQHEDYRFFRVPTDGALVYVLNAHVLR